MTVRKRQKQRLWFCLAPADHGRNFSNDRRNGMSTDRYVSPLSERYASKEMQYIF